MTELFTTVSAIAADPTVDLDPVRLAERRAARRPRGRRPRAWEGDDPRQPLRAVARAAGGDRGSGAGKIAFAVTRDAGHRLGRRLAASPTACRSSSRRSTGCRSSSAGPPSASSRSRQSEALGLAFAVVILVVAFGSVLAMGLPIGVALAGIIVGSMLATVLSTNFFAMPDFAIFLGVMIGLGVGHRLRPVHRHPLPREPPPRPHARGGDRHRHRHRRPGRHLRGRSPSSISFLGMIVMGVSFISGLAISSAPSWSLTDRGRVAHAPARPPRVRRRAGRGQPLAGRHRHRLRRPRAGRRRSAHRRADRSASRWRCSCSLLGFFLAPLKRRGAEAGGQARARDLRLPVEPPRAAPPVAGGHRRHRHPGGARAAGARHAPRLLRREQLPGGHHHPPGLRAPGRRVRPGLQRPVLPRRAGRRGGRPARCSSRSPPTSRPTPASPSSPPPCPTR